MRRANVQVLYYYSRRRGVEHYKWLSSNGVWLNVTFILMPKLCSGLLLLTLAPYKMSVSLSLF